MTTNKQPETVSDLTITDETFAETYKAAINKDTPENRQRLWDKLQELHDPQPPPLEPSDFDINI